MGARSDRKAESSAGVNLRQLEELLEFMGQHGLEELEYEQGGLHVRLKKQASNSAPVGTHQRGAPEAGASLAHSAPPLSGSDASQGTKPEADVTEGLHVVKSPIVGTFYEAPTPGAEPFVKVGDAIQVGQVLCIIEAMKLMNEIESDVSGQVVRLMVQNGQPVEYGEPLFAIRPAP